MFDRLQLIVADFDGADDIIEDIDDDTWVSVVSLLPAMTPSMQS